MQGNRYNSIDEIRNEEESFLSTFINLKMKGKRKCRIVCFTEKASSCSIKMLLILLKAVVRRVIKNKRIFLSIIHKINEVMMINLICFNLMTKRINKRIICKVAKINQ